MEGLDLSARIVLQDIVATHLRTKIAQRDDNDTAERFQRVIRSYTKLISLVKAGNTVTLIVDNDGVRVAADVVARTSGGLGDEVSVYNPQTNKTLSGTVVGPDRVELNLSGETQ